MSFTPREGQDEVLAAREPVVVVLGGAGTGKTSVAAAAVRQILDEAAAARSGGQRALFLSFSRAAVSQIVDRTGSTLGPRADRVEVTTFHAFAWALLRRWGGTIGLPEPKLVSPSEGKLFGTQDGITYNDLLPLASRLLDISAIRKHLQRRWAVIVCDEFQDTSDAQFDLLLRIRGDARLLLLGDLNQCIYSNLPNARGVGGERIAAALALPHAREIRLPDVSHRDPTNILPAAAAAIRQRDFGHDAVVAALDSGRLEVRHHTDVAAEGALVAGLVAELQAAGHQTVGIFSHHVDATAALSDELNGAGITHEIIGLPDTVTSALQAQFEMLRFAADEGPPEAISRALAIFVTSTERGSAIPELARMIINQRSAPATLLLRLRGLSAALEAANNVAEMLEVAANAPAAIGLTRGERAWARGTALLRTLLGPRLCRADDIPAGTFDRLQESLRDQHVSLLTASDTEEAAAVQLMGLYQSKGREADATIVVLRGNDYFGREASPMPVGSRLLYVVLTRARSRTVVLTLGAQLPPLIFPLAQLGARI